MEATTTPYSNGTTAETSPPLEDARDNNSNEPAPTAGTDTATAPKTQSHFESRGSLDTLVAAALKPLAAAEDYPQRHHSPPQRYESPGHNHSIRNNANNHTRVKCTFKHVYIVITWRLVRIRAQDNRGRGRFNSRSSCNGSPSDALACGSTQRCTEITAHGDRAMPEMNLRATKTWIRITCLASRIRTITTMAACILTRTRTPRTQFVTIITIDPQKIR
ncbi:hypothetical protein EC957_000684 [Mortierella hygrophila]|uniref:Uncharacterized protein n=1 Tax=Mortierella hygrophila TaxID=979708 RepID=A0A9P6FFY9_9FUNG|nr:hypothetical protein EC957_000684 [Mortierella hygrophila]